MARCRWCCEEGWLTRVDSNGLCEKCGLTHLPLILSHSRSVIDAMRVVTSDVYASYKLSIIPAALAHCECLIPYDNAGVPTLTSPPAAVIDELVKIRAGIVSEIIHGQVYAARQKALDATTAAGKLGGYGKAIQALDRLANDQAEIAEIEEVIVGLRAERDALRFDLLEQKAIASMAKGRPKAALGYYVDAMLALKTDTTPDEEQWSRIERARSQIVALGGTIPECWR